MHDADYFADVIIERASRVAAAGREIGLQESSLDGLQKRIDVTDAAEGHRGTPAHRISDRKHFATDDRRLGGKGGGKIEHQPVFLIYAVDDDVQVGAFPNDLGDELMQIGGQDMNDLRHDVPRRAVFLDGVSRRDNVTVMQMKAGSADLDFSGLVRSAGILSVFQDADGGPLRALNHIRWRPVSADAHGAAHARMATRQARSERRHLRSATTIMK